jgi:hypothetical protein
MYQHKGRIGIVGHRHSRGNAHNAIMDDK